MFVVLPKGGRQATFRGCAKLTRLICAMLIGESRKVEENSLHNHWMSKEGVAEDEDLVAMRGSGLG